MSLKISAFSAHVITVRGDITTDRSPLMKPLRVRSATATMLEIVRLPDSDCQCGALPSTISTSMSCGR